MSRTGRQSAKKKDYAITVWVKLTDAEADALYDDGARRRAMLPADDATLERVAAAVRAPDAQIRKVRGVDYQAEAIERRDAQKLAYTRTHREKVARRARAIADVLRAPAYSFESAHRAPRALAAGGTQWINAKAARQRHFATNMFSGNGACLNSAAWRAANPERARLEDFKGSLRARYPRLIDHVASFWQRSAFRGPVDYARTFLVARAYDESWFPARRFSDAQLAEFARDCQEQGLRVLVDERDYRGIEARFVLVADAAVDLAQAWRFALSLPAK